jgi:hypothetical protein
MKAILIDLYTGKAETLPQDEVSLATKGLKKVETADATTYKGEEYIVVVLK